MAAFRRAFKVWMLGGAGVALVVACEQGPFVDWESEQQALTGEGGASDSSSDSSGEGGPTDSSTWSDVWTFDAGDGGDSGCSSSEWTCINDMRQYALNLLGSNNQCFTNVINSFGGSAGCSSASLTSCISTFLRSSTVWCGRRSSYGGGAASSGCLDQHEAQNAICKDGGCRPADLNCAACADASASLEINGLDLRPPNDGANFWCNPAGNPIDGGPNSGQYNHDLLVEILVHEAAHNCVGAHDYYYDDAGHRWGGTGNDAGLATACGLPDPWTVGAALLRCFNLSDAGPFGGTPQLGDAASPPPSPTNICDGGTDGGDAGDAGDAGRTDAGDAGRTDAGDAGTAATDASMAAPKGVMMLRPVEVPEGAAGSSCKTR